MAKIESKAVFFFSSFSWRVSGCARWVVKEKENNNIMMFMYMGPIQGIIVYFIVRNNLISIRISNVGIIIQTP